MATNQALEVGKKLVEYCKSGDVSKAVETLYSSDIESHEAMSMPDMPARSKGIDAVRKKIKNGKKQWKFTSLK